MYCILKSERSILCPIGSISSLANYHVGGVFPFRQYRRGPRWVVDVEKIVEGRGDVGANINEGVETAIHDIPSKFYRESAEDLPLEILWLAAFHESCRL